MRVMTKMGMSSEVHRAVMADIHVSMYDGQYDQPKHPRCGVCGRFRSRHTLCRLAWWDRSASCWQHDRRQGWEAAAAKTAP